MRIYIQMQAFVFRYPPTTDTANTKLMTRRVREVSRPLFGVRLCLRRVKSKALLARICNPCFKHLYWWRADNEVVCMAYRSAPNPKHPIPPQGFEIWDDRVPTLSFGLFMFFTDEQGSWLRDAACHVSTLRRADNEVICMLSPFRPKTSLYRRNLSIFGTIEFRLCHFFEIPPYSLPAAGRSG